ncbi:MAG: hypothetical protein ACHRHE_06320 [Tepidisphaerales bacterium]
MENQEIVSRLEKLEKSNRRLRWAAAAMGAGLVAAVFLGAEQRMPEIVTERIRLVDSDGKLRGAMGFDKDGTFFFLNDQNGRMRTSLAAQKGGGFVNIKDDNGKTRTLMSYDENGSVVKAQDDQGLFSMLIEDQRGPAMQVGQDNGRIRIVAPMIDVLQEPQPKDQPQPPRK